MDLRITCPLCESRSVRTKQVSELTVVCSCDQCGVLFTIQLSTRRAIESTPPERAELAT